MITQVSEIYFGGFKFLKDTSMIPIQFNHQELYGTIFTIVIKSIKY